ncbi:hypothetical protein AB0J09_55820, partial [Nonomuraea sp. NPDC049784]
AEGERDRQRDGGEGVGQVVQGVAEQRDRAGGAAESLAPLRPHPGTESATKNMLMGTPIALMERAREMIRKGLGKHT